MRVHDLETLASETFLPRHIGPSDDEIAAMLAELGYDSLEAFLDDALPPQIRTDRPPALDPPRPEHEVLEELRALAAQNRRVRSFLGMGFHDTVTPAVLQRHILENPGWYTPYTPYQAEIAQGRLEALLIFQTMVADLTGLEVANASLLDEASAAAEAMGMAYALRGGEGRRRFLAAADLHPPVLDVLRTRAWARRIELDIAHPGEFRFAPDVFGVLLAYPTTEGAVEDYRDVVAAARAVGAVVAVDADLLALTLLPPPGEWGADIAVGTTQRFGVPLGYGGPHAAYLATREAYVRHLPGRLVGVSRDARGRAALRLTLQTREQHIRRDKATSNICTAQTLPAIVAAMYAVHHGPEGLRRIAQRIHRHAAALAAGLEAAGYRLAHRVFFDTLRVEAPGRVAAILEAARARGINLRAYGDEAVGVAFGERVGARDVADVLAAFGVEVDVDALLAEAPEAPPPPFERTSAYLTHPVFHRYRSETELMRYLERLRSRDFALTHGMIPLGSCTMKLNAAAEMLPLSWPEWTDLHPFAPAEQAPGYRRLFADLEAWLADLTGLAAVSLQPNAGSQGELAGLLVIRKYHEARGQGQRDVCLIPQSAHGTNPASAVLAGLRVVPVRTDAQGNVDVDDLRAQAAAHADRLAAAMITYPSTHGVFEERIREICAIVHEHGGQVYLDGANLNALVGWVRPGELGADVVHVNLHKTFCIPHGGGGPGMGPIAVAAHLAPYLPGRPEGIGAVAMAPWGSASILPISWVYLRLMGAEGLRRATAVAILNANYLAHRLAAWYPILYRGRHGRVAHECIVDLRPLRARAGVEAEDVAKRLIDYGFHAPTVAWPVLGTLMIEPTESESKRELDRFVEAMRRIREEVRAIEEGRWDRQDNPLKHAPHPALDVVADDWPHPYSRREAAYPAPWLEEAKFWPAVARVEGAWGDRHLVCACPPWFGPTDAETPTAAASSA